MFRTAITDFFSGHGKSLAYVGTALALTGIGTATAAAATSSGPAPGFASTARHMDVGDHAGGQHGSKVTIHHAREDLAHKAPEHKAAGHHSTAGHSTAGHSTAGHSTSGHSAAKKTATHKAAPAHHAATQHAAKHARVHVVRHSHHAMTWKQVRDALAARTYPKAAPGKLPLADRLLPASASGGQAYLPVTAARMANATTIVRQALSKHMGLRAAVIAVATSMQESTLENISYGDRDSLGLFQQRPSAGWGTPAEITNPTYAADAFLNALRGHQAADPEWASQPLWANAQAVQNSGFPYAYAKWEAQAAQLVSAIARHMA